MTYAANVLEVMIASPGDVLLERNIVRDVLSEWNAVNSRVRKAVLLPLGWDTHVAPDMSTKPQKLINEKILSHADLLIGVFWTRVGTATDDYVSGSVEEIEEHIKTGKPAMLYFSRIPVHPDSVDPAQYASLQRFRETCEKRGLYETYSDVNEFRLKLARQLAVRMNDVASPAASQLTTQIPELSREARMFLKEASKTNTGQINRFSMDQALVIQVNGQSFQADLSDGRARAHFESAIEELEDGGLIADSSMGKRTVFQLTARGFRMADLVP
jgi:hypothetical protein